jgi:SPP1 gp7 family putative phage head morphogenesis protein
MNNPVDIKDFKAPFTSDAIDLYVANVWIKNITPVELSTAYHTKITGILEDAILKGFDGSDHVFEAAAKPKKPWSLRESIKLGLRRNVYYFSAAKQYQQVRQMAELIAENISYEDFKAYARKIFKDFNENYLRTEWSTAISQSQQARQWSEVQDMKDVFPFLEYRTQRDSKVRDEHAALDGIVLPVDDPFWKRYHPCCGWNCRCFTVSHEKARVTNLKTRDLSDLKDPKKFPDVFKINPGDSQQIFNENVHPYFREGKGHKKLKANNFNLPIP